MTKNCLFIFLLSASMFGCYSGLSDQEYLSKTQSDIIISKDTPPTKEETSNNTVNLNWLSNKVDGEKLVTELSEQGSNADDTLLSESERTQIDSQYKEDNDTFIALKNIKQDLLNLLPDNEEKKKLKDKFDELDEKRLMNQEQRKKNIEKAFVGVNSRKGKYSTLRIF